MKVKLPSALCSSKFLPLPQQTHTTFSIPSFSYSLKPFLGTYIKWDLHPSLAPYAALPSFHSYHCLIRLHIQLSYILFALSHKHRLSEHKDLVYVFTSYTTSALCMTHDRSSISISYSSYVHRVWKWIRHGFHLQSIHRLFGETDANRNATHCLRTWPVFMGFPGSSAGKEYACNPGDPGSIPSWEDLLEMGYVTFSGILGLPCWLSW